jgi:hypothetical protein
MAESKIENDKNQFYVLPIPESFFERPRRTRRITVSLAYTPYVRSTRLDYITTKIKFRLVRGNNLEEVQHSFNNDYRGEVSLISEFRSGKADIGPSRRDRCTLQRTTWQLKSFRNTPNLFIVVTRQDTSWGREFASEFENYSLVITITDRENQEADLYNQIREKLRARGQARR